MNRSDASLIKTNTPSPLQELSQWVCWREEDRDGKPTKVPYIPGTSRGASSTAARDWRTFDNAMVAFESDSSLAGVGFVFSADDPYCGVDIDDCRDADSGDIAPWAQAIIDSLGSYTEISPSGTGVKIFLQAKKPGRKCRKAYESGEVEMYDHARFFTVTGVHLTCTPETVEDRQEALDRLYRTVFGDATDPDHSILDTEVATADLADDEVVRLMTTTGKSQEKFSALWAGRWNEYYNSPSEGDASLVFKLAYYTKDAAQIDRLFRQSGLYRDKWDELRGDESYGQITIKNALAKVTKQFVPRGKRQRAVSKQRTHGGKGLPRIIIDDIQLQDLTDQTLAALTRANDPPTMFVRAGTPSRIKLTEKETYIIEAYDRARMRCRLAQAAVWLSLRKQGKDDIVEVDAIPPLYLAENIMSMTEWPFPPLVGIARAPILRPDGIVCTTPGYDPETMLVYAPSKGLSVPPIPESPTKDQVEVARDRLLDLIADFPFDSEASRANMLSLLFSILMRSAINGSIPMLLVDAPVQGTGKTLLVKVIASIAVEVVPVQTAPTGRKDKEEEWRKRISTTLLESQQIGLVDNLPETDTFDSVSLAAALTSHEWIDRKLGTNQSISVPSRCVWVGTGNNLRVTGDMPRRCYTSRIDSNDERPWERHGFRHEDIETYVQEHRGELLHAAYTLIRAWYAAGKPKPRNRVSFGSFQEWADTVGGVLHTAGIPGFLANLDAVRSVQDDDAAQWRAFFDAWWEAFGETAVTADDIMKSILFQGQLADEVIPDVLAVPMEKGEGSLKRSLGRYLSRLTGRIFEGRKLSDAGKHSFHKVRMWNLVEQAKEDESDPQAVKDSQSCRTSGGLEVKGGFIDPNTRARENDETHAHIYKGPNNLRKPPNLHEAKSAELEAVHPDCDGRVII